MFARVFIPMFFGALYASAWWAYAIFAFGTPNAYLYIPLTVASLPPLIVLALCAYDDICDN